MGGGVRIARAQFSGLSLSDSNLPSGTWYEVMSISSAGIRMIIFFLSLIRYGTPYTYQYTVGEMCSLLATVELENLFPTPGPGREKLTDKHRIDFDDRLEWKQKAD